jgi:hypothetical protein
MGLAPVLTTRGISLVGVLGTQGGFPILRAALARPRHTPTLLVLLTLALVASPGVVSAQAEAPAPASPTLEKAALRLRYGLSLRQGEQVDLGPGLTYSGLTPNDVAAWAAYYGLGPEWLGAQLSLQREAFSLYREADRVSEGSLLRLALGAVARRQLGPVRGELSLGYGFAQLPMFTASDTPSPAFQRGGRHAALVGARVRFPIVQRAQGEVRGEFPLALSSSAAGQGGSSSGLSVGASVLVPVKRMGPWEGAVVLDYQLVKDRLTADSGTRSEQTLHRVGAALELSWFGAEGPGSTLPPPPGDARPGSLSIQVVDAETKGPLAGAQVTLITEAKAWPARAADAKGQVVEEQLAPGEVLVRVAAQGYEPAEESTTVRSGERATVELRARKQPPPVGRLRVVVVDKRDNAPVAEAKVEVGDKEVETDATGQARLGELPPGPVLVKISAPGFQSVEEAAVIVGGQEAEMPVPLVTLKRLGYATVSGTVRSTRQGRPVVATLSIPAAKVSTRTDAQGSFSVKLKPGTYRIIISAKGHLTQTKSITVRDGEQAIYNVDLFPRGR